MKTLLPVCFVICILLAACDHSTEPTGYGIFLTTDSASYHYNPAGVKIKVTLSNLTPDSVMLWSSAQGPVIDVAFKMGNDWIAMPLHDPVPWKILVLPSFASVSDTGTITTGKGEYFVSVITSSRYIAGGRTSVESQHFVIK